MNKILTGTGHALLAASLSVLGLALSPAVMNVLPPKAAMGVMLAGIVYQSVTGKAIQVTIPEAQAPAPTVATPAVAAETK